MLRVADAARLLLHLALLAVAWSPLPAFQTALHNASDDGRGGLMSRAFLTKLFDYIDAKIDEHAAATSSDGGLLESEYRRDIEDELMAMCGEEP
jgi:hypothetical protein